MYYAFFIIELFAQWLHILFMAPFLALPCRLCSSKFVWHPPPVISLTQLPPPALFFPGCKSKFGPTSGVRAPVLHELGLSALYLQPWGLAFRSHFCHSDFHCNAVASCNFCASCSESHNETLVVVHRPKSWPLPSLFGHCPRHTIAKGCELLSIYILIRTPACRSCPTIQPVPHCHLSSAAGCELEFSTLKLASVTHPLPSLHQFSARQNPPPSGTSSL